MFWIFYEALGDLDTTSKVVGLGALALGLVPMIWFWAKGSAYYRTPPLEVFPDPHGSQLMPVQHIEGSTGGGRTMVARAARRRVAQAARRRRARLTPWTGRRGAARSLRAPRRCSPPTGRAATVAAGWLRRRRPAVGQRAGDVTTTRNEGPRVGGVEVRSIDYVPLERAARQALAPRARCGS